MSHGRGKQWIEEQWGWTVLERSAAAERIAAELDFCEQLAELHPQQQPAWQTLIDAAWDRLEELSRSGRLDKLQDTVEQIESDLSAIGQTAKTYTVHCVGHAHIDMNWQWSWPETVAAVNDNFLTVLRLMDEFPDFKFSQSQGAIYRIVQQYNPDLLQRIREKIDAGRWEVTAPLWVEGDKNLPSGESLTRHLLYTRRFTSEALGRDPEQISLDWAPDTFGHAATIPGILAGGGVSRYYFCRGGKFDKPPIFWWEGPDGSRILCNRETTWYNDHVGLHVLPAFTKFCRETGLEDWMLVYGIGDHGGGPTRKDLKRIIEFDSWPLFPNFRFAVTDDYYSILEENGDRWPVLKRELNYEFTGCYTSQSEIKRTNRLGENLCCRAESAAALAWAAIGMSYPAASLAESWRRTIFGHFHDILPGSGVPGTRDWHMGEFQRTAADTAMAMTHSWRAMAERVDTSFSGPEQEDPKVIDRVSVAHIGGPGFGTSDGQISQATPGAGWPQAFVVFNPTTTEQDDTVHVRLWDNGFFPPEKNLPHTRFIARTADGREIPVQHIGKGQELGHLNVELAVPVRVGPLGYAAFTIEAVGRRRHEEISTGYSPGKSIPEVEGYQPRVSSGRHWIENEHIRAEFDPMTGGMTSLIDKTDGTDLAADHRQIGLLEYILERPRGMSAWTLGDVQRIDCPLELSSFKMTCDGPHEAACRTVIKIGQSTITTRFGLRAGRKWLDVDLDVDWREIGSDDNGIPSLAMRFPTGLANATGRYEIPFGHIERQLNDGQDVPAINWGEVIGETEESDTKSGLAVLNEGKYGYSLENSTLRVRLLRSSYSPDPLPEIGNHKIHLGIMPEGTIRTAGELTKLGLAFNHPLQPVGTTVHEGDWPARADALSATSPDNVVITGVKKCEDEDALVFRLLETAGEETSATVGLNKNLFGSVSEATEVDFLERPAAGNSAETTAEGFRAKLQPWSVAGVKVQFVRD
ncbi:MAG: alpha-mannosidase [Phycisphaerae bacterium]